MYMERKRIQATRSCDSIQIPDGFIHPIPAGMGLTITQALGGTYTVLTDQGFMVRIEGKDADVLGIDPAEAKLAASGSDHAADTPLETRIWDELKTCYDPEIPVNVVDMGLIYQVAVVPPIEPQGNGSLLEIKMTLTTPGCGMGDVLKQDIEKKLSTLAGVAAVKVEIVLDPPWTPELMSEAARLELGF
mgnify:CR=1 FL=1